MRNLSKTFTQFLALAISALILILVFNAVKLFVDITLSQPIILGSYLMLMFGILFLTISGIMIVYALLDYWEK